MKLFLLYYPQKLKNILKNTKLIKENIKVAKSQRVFSIKCTTTFNFDKKKMMNSDIVHFLEDGMKIYSEI